MAVVPVILFHAGIAPFTGGFIGVDVFFVISGYLISTIILNEMDAGRFSIMRFYERRARRILPALFFVMLVCILFAWFWLMPRDLKDFAESLAAVTLFVSNFLFWLEAGYFEATAELKPLLHTWSLAVEEQYYIFFPVLLMMLNPFGRRAILIGLIAIFVFSFALSQWGIYNHPSATFFLLPARGWELLVGVFASIYLRGHSTFTRTIHTELLSLIGLAMIILPIFVYDKSTPFPGAYALPATIGTALIILFARTGTFAERLLAAKPMVAIGLVSYSAYLWHQPVFAFFKHRFGSAYFEDAVYLLIALSLLLATISYWLVERPFRRAATLKQLGVSMAVCFLMVIGATTTFLTVIDENYKAVPSYRWALEHASPELISYIENRDVGRECANDIQAIGLKICRFGATDQEPTMVMWGDSLAGALLYGIDQVARENGVAGLAFITNGCPPILGLRNTELSTCTPGTQARVMEEIATLSGIKVALLTGNLVGAMTARNVLIDGNPTSAVIVGHKMEMAMKTFEMAGITSLFVEQGPTFDAHVAEHEMQRLRSGYEKPQAISRSSHVASVAPTRVLAGAFDDYIETTDLYCNKSTCPSVDSGGNLVIFDRNHVTEKYSLKLAQLVFSQLK